MMRSLLSVLFLLLAQSIFAEKYDNSIESAFQSFYGEPMKLVMGDKGIKLLVNEIEENPSIIPVKMVFDIPFIEKILLLKLKNTGYTNTGYFNRNCASESLFIASYTLDSKKSISEIETRMHTYCAMNTITLLLWVKTHDGHYYSNSVTFKTTEESPG